MMREVRHERLLAHLRAVGPASVQELSDALESSPATIRRDLEVLSERGALVRTWGGARLGGTEDDPFAEASLDHAEAKRTMAQLAAGLIPEGSTVAIDIGTSTHYLTNLLQDRALTVITASIPVFESLRDAPHIDLVLLGGEYNPRYQCLEGAVAAETMARYSVDIAVLGCSGVTLRGQVRDTSSAQVAVKRALAAAASQCVLLADSSKFPGQGPEVALSLTEIDFLVTESPSHSLHTTLASLPAGTHTKVVHP